MTRAGQLKLGATVRQRTGSLGRSRCAETEHEALQRVIILIWTLDRHFLQKWMCRKSGSGRGACARFLSSFAILTLLPTLTQD